MPATKHSKQGPLVHLRLGLCLVLLKQFYRGVAGVLEEKDASQSNVKADLDSTSFHQPNTTRACWR